MFFTVSELVVSPLSHNNKRSPQDQKGGDEDGEGPNPPVKEASDVKPSTKEPGLELVFVITKAIKAKVWLYSGGLLHRLHPYTQSSFRLQQEQRGGPKLSRSD